MNYRRPMSFLAFSAALVLAVAPRILPAQQASECPSYAATLRSGTLAQRDSQSRAFAAIQGCPASIRAAGIGAALDRRRTLSSFDDPNTEAFAFATRDRAVVDMLGRLAADAAASPTSRVLAIATLLAMVTEHPGPELEYFVKFREGEVCAAGGSPIAHARTGRPLAADSVRRMVATLAPLERSRSTDAAVRSAAHCALNVLRHQELGQFAQLGPLNAGDLSLGYACGSEFRVTSRAPFSVLAALYLPGAARPPAFTIATHQRSPHIEMSPAAELGRQVITRIGGTVAGDSDATHI